jgi:predicted lipoprotein with Yx(FWY)xxD motif
MRSMWKGTVRSLGVISVIGLLGLVACGKSSSIPSTSGGGASSPPAATGGATVSTASVGGMGTVLVDSNGMTLYYLKSEPIGSITCTGSCATNWPPLLLPSGTTAPTAGTGLKAADLGTIARPDGGTQVTYKGKALYLFVGDTSAGQANGQGTADFFVVTTSGSSGGGNGGGAPGY